MCILALVNVITVSIYTFFLLEIPSYTLKLNARGTWYKMCFDLPEEPADEYPVWPLVLAEVIFSIQPFLMVCDDLSYLMSFIGYNPGNWGRS